MSRESSRGSDRLVAILFFELVDRTIWLSSHEGEVVVTSSDSAAPFDDHSSLLWGRAVRQQLGAKQLDGEQEGKPSTTLIGPTARDGLASDAIHDLPPRLWEAAGFTVHANVEATVRGAGADSACEGRARGSVPWTA